MPPGLHVLSPGTLLALAGELMKRRLLLGAATGGLGSCLLCAGLSCAAGETVASTGSPRRADPETPPPDAPVEPSDAGSHDSQALDVAPSDASPEDAPDEQADAAPDCGPPTSPPSACQPVLDGFMLGSPGDFQDHGLHPVGTGKLIDRVLVGHDCGGLYALRALCPHMGCTLALESLLSEDGVTCGCHGSQFDLQGRVIKGPAKKDLAPEAIVLGCDGLLYIDRAKTVDRSARLVVEEA